MKTRNRNILCITGTRADYPRVKSVLKEINRRDSLHLDILVTGSHLLEDYGYSIQEILQDGFTIAGKVPMFEGEYNSPHGMAKAAARCTSGVADVLQTLQPDLVLLTVDRVETLAAAVAVSLMNYPIAHIQGGEVTGTIDESIRHAVTKLSHIHFPATKDAAERIIKMGEDPEFVFPVGCPYIDVITNLRNVPKKELAEKYGFDPEKRLIILIQHPVTTEHGAAKAQINTTLDALKHFQFCEIVVFYSNTDAGGKDIIAELNKFDNFRVFPNIESRDFLSLMNCADLMVGNSSAAIREAPSFSLPAINIGTRQAGRLRAGNVLDVGHDPTAIKDAIEFALNDVAFRSGLTKISNPYGDGKSAKRIVDKLQTVNITAELIQKQIAYE